MATCKRSQIEFQDSPIFDQFFTNQIQLGIDDPTIFSILTNATKENCEEIPERLTYWMAAWFRAQKGKPPNFDSNLDVGSRHYIGEMLVEMPNSFDLWSEFNDVLIKQRIGFLSFYNLRIGIRENCYEILFFPWAVKPQSLVSAPAAHETTPANIVDLTPAQLDKLLVAIKDDSELPYLESCEAIFNYVAHHLEKKDWKKAIVVKELTHSMLSRRNHDFLTTIRAVLMRGVDSEMDQFAKEAGMVDVHADIEVLTRAILESLEREGSRPGVLPLLLFVTALKICSVERGEGTFSLAIHGLFECRCYLLAGMAAYAKQSFNWIQDCNTPLHLDDFSVEQKQDLATHLSAAAEAAFTNEQYRFASELVDESSRLLAQGSPQFVEVSEINSSIKLKLGKVAQTEGRPEESLEFVKEGLKFARDAGVDAEGYLLGLERDEEMGRKVRMEYEKYAEAYHNAEITGDLDYLKLDLPNLTKILGMPPDVVRRVVELQEKKTEGNFGDKEKLELIELSLVGSRTAASKGNYRDAFMFLVDGIKAVISLGETGEALVSDLVAEVDAISSNLSPEDIAEYNSLVEIARSFRVEFTPLRASEPNQNSSKTQFAEQLSGSYLKRVEQLNATLMKKFLRNWVPGVSWHSFEVGAEIERSTLLASEKSYTTPEAMNLTINSWRQNLGLIASCAFMEAGLEFGTTYDFEILIEESSPNVSFQELKKTYPYFRQMCDWILDGYRSRKIVECLDRQGESERADLRHLSSKLSGALDEVMEDDFALNLQLTDEVKGSVAGIKLLFGEAMFESQASVESNQTRVGQELTDSTFVYFSFSLDQENIGIIGFSHSQIHFSMTKDRSKRWRSVCALVRDYCSNDITDLEFQNSWKQLSGKASFLPKSKDCNFIDFSNHDSLCPIVENPELQFQFSNGPNVENEILASSSPVISFWAPLGPNDDNFVENPNSRSVALTSNQAIAIDYYSEPSRETLSSIGRGVAELQHKYRLLPFSCFESWMFDDLAAKSNVNVQKHCSDESTRHAFVKHDWKNVDCLHISTHGESVDGHPELNHLIMRGDNQFRLHYFDVLALDWSNTSLIFLNCCMTCAGQYRGVGEVLSLAWAFRAGGAKSVVATRWPVSDAAAWLFAQKFYECWISEGNTIRDAFFKAQVALRANPIYASPACWGAFSLLD